MSTTSVRTYTDSHRRGPTHPTRREALLRPEWRRLYPGLQTGIWLPAGDVAAYVRGHLEVLEGERAQNHRALSALHFEFRGEGTLRARGM
jgi:hypothetical protein